jgi:hypothetical protein
VNQKMSAELAAEKGVILGEPYTPPGRLGSFDVPSYDDIADLNQLFKRFANTAASYTEAGGTVVGKGADFLVAATDLGTIFMCEGEVLTSCTITKMFTLADGSRFSVVQLGSGAIEVRGADSTIVVRGRKTTPGQYQGLTVLYLGGVWWCVPFGASGGGGGGPVPIFNTSADSFPITKDHVGGLIAMDTGTRGNNAVVVPLDDGTIPVGSVVVVSNVGDLSALKVLIAATPGVVIEDVANAVISRWRSAALIKIGTNLWLINAGSEGGTVGAVPLPPVLKTAVSGPEEIAVTWTAPASDGGHSITSYFAESSVDGVAWTRRNAFLGTALSGSVTGLAAGVTVQVRLRASNVVGDSDPSNVLSAVPGPAIVPVPTVAHSGLGSWTITNFSASYMYTVTANAGTPSVSGGMVTNTAVNSITKLTVQARLGAPSESIWLERRAYEYHSENRPDCRIEPRYAGWNCFHCGDAECVGCQ